MGLGLCQKLERGWHTSMLGKHMGVTGQSLFCNIQEWVDYRMIWNASDFDGIKLARLSSSDMWTPDIYLLNKWATVVIALPRAKLRAKLNLFVCRASVCYSVCLIPSAAQSRKNSSMISSSQFFDFTSLFCFKGSLDTIDFSGGLGSTTASASD